LTIFYAYSSEIISQNIHIIQISNKGAKIVKRQTFIIWISSHIALFSLLIVEVFKS